MPDRAGVACAHARTATDEPAEVGGLGQGALATRRGDLERVALALIGEERRDTLAYGEGDAVGMVDVHAQAPSTEDLSEQHLDVGLALGQTAFDIGLKGGHLNRSSGEKK